MSIKLMAQVFEHSPYRGTQKLIHLILANHANEDGICWPSYPTMARQANCTEQNVQRHIREMEQAGWVARSARPGRSNLIMVRGETPYEGVDAGAFPGMDAGAFPGMDADASPGVDAHVRGGEAPTSTRVDAGAPHNLKEPSIEPRAAARRDDPIFEIVCQVCKIDQGQITKDARGRVNAAVKQLREIGVSPGDVIVRARQYRKLYPDAVLTPQALTGNWSQLDPATPAIVENRPEIPLFEAEAPATPEQKAQAQEAMAKIMREFKARGEELDGGEPART